MPGDNHRRLMSGKPSAVIVNIAGRVTYTKTYESANYVLCDAAKRTQWAEYKKAKLTIIFKDGNVDVNFHVNKNDVNLSAYDIAKAYTAFYPDTN